MTQNNNQQRVLLVALDLITRAENGWATEESLDELERLVDTAGGTVIGREIQRRLKPDTATYIGRGKAESIRKMASETGANLVVFDGELTPVQQRNLEEIIQCAVIDRTTVILDIFALRARSREAKLQVELAQLNYLLPRMTGKGLELSRLAGGIGTRGPGETKLEVDRRKIRDRIATVNKELAEVKAHRARLRKRRSEPSLPVVALTGYTNAGKSTLHRALARSQVLVENRLFATLDATRRRVEPPGGEPFLLIDTVGFIHNLPTFLIAAFRSTLEEVGEADLLLHVVDGSHPKQQEQMQTVEDVLAKLGAGDKPTITVYNKSDRIDRKHLHQLLDKKDGVAVSAALGHHIDALHRAIQRGLAHRREVVELVVPYDKSFWMSRMFEHGRVISQKFLADGTYVKAELNKSLVKRMRKQQDCHFL